MHDESTVGEDENNLATILDGKYFVVRENIDKENKKIMASCVLCSPTVVNIKGYSGSSTNFLSHLRKKHGEKVIEEYKEYVTAKRAIRWEKRRKDARNTEEYTNVCKTLIIDNQ